MYSRKIIYFMVGVLFICGLVVMIGEMGKNLEADETEYRFRRTTDTGLLFVRIGRSIR